MKIRNCMFAIITALLLAITGSSLAFCKEAHPALRGFSEFGMGTLIGTAVGGGTLFAGVMIETKKTGRMDGDYFWPILVSGAVYPAALAGGSYLGGYLTDSKAKAWTPFVGAYAGAAVGYSLAYLLYKKDYPVLAAIFALVMPIIGTITAMEISHAHEKRTKKESSENVITTPLMFTFVF